MIRGAILVLVVAGMAGVAYKVITLIILFGFHKTVFNHLPGPCRLVPGIDYGSEDMQLMSNGFAFISSGFSMAFAVGDKPGLNRGKGNIFLFDFNHPEQNVRRLKIESSTLDLTLFTPHGMGLWEDEKTGIVTLFVVNHLPGKDTIERFQFNPKKWSLAHTGTYESELFGSLNNLVATSDKTFYTTNFLSTSSVFTRQLEMYLELRWGSIINYNGEKYQTSATNLHLPNGIAMSRDNKFLYVAADVGSVYVYSIQMDGSLNFLKAHPLNTAVDNINVDPSSGTLWIGGLPIIHQTLRHIEHPASKAASQVLHVMMGKEDIVDMVEVLADNGTLITASTSGLHYRGKLLVGTIQTKMLFCEINIPLTSVRP